MNENASLSREPSQLALYIGIGTIVLGVLSILLPQVTGVAVGMLVGALVIVAGAAQATIAFRSIRFGDGLLRFLAGGLAVVGGLIMLVQPGTALAMITIIVVFYLAADGIVRIFAALQLKPETGWGWLLLDGILAIVLGAIVLSKWPESAWWVVGVMVGIHLIARGCALILLRAVDGAIRGE
ncbi:MAG: HdeD family acid-resistance protein [Planctomycetota bacterium]